MSYLNLHSRFLDSYKSRRYMRLIQLYVVFFIGIRITFVMFMNIDYSKNLLCRYEVINLPYYANLRHCVHTMHSKHWYSFKEFACFNIPRIYFIFHIKFIYNMIKQTYTFLPEITDISPWISLLRRDQRICLFWRLIKEHISWWMRPFQALVVIRSGSDWRYLYIRVPSLFITGEINDEGDVIMLTVGIASKLSVSSGNDCKSTGTDLIEIDLRKLLAKSLFQVSAENRQNQNWS